MIRQLLDLGYLRSGITPELEETLGITDDGLIYLRSCGVFVSGAPRVVGGTTLARPLLGRRRRASVFVGSRAEHRRIRSGFAGSWF